MRPHVAELSTVHGWQDNRVFRRHSRSLARHGYRVTLVAVGDGPDRVVDGVEVLSRPRRGGRVRRLIVDLPRTLATALRLDADIYHLHDPELALLIPLLRRRGAAVVYDAHEDLPSQVLAKSYLPPGVRRLAPGLSRLLLGGVDRLADHVVTATSTVAERFDPAHTTVVHNYPELLNEADAAPYEQRRPVALYVGGVSESRGAVTMLDGFAQAALPPEWRLEVVGPGATVELRERMTAHAASDRVDAVGVLPPVEARSRMSNARIGLAVLHATAAYVDALPTKLFEYMAAGLPVIASDFPRWREIVDAVGCGLLVDPADPHALADALRALSRDTEGAREMGERGRRAVLSNYTWRGEEEHLLAAIAAAQLRRGTPSTRPGARRRSTSR